MKKYLIIAAAAALTLASCAKIESYTEKNDELIPIAFSNYTPKALAKADSTYVGGTVLHENSQFAVYAWQTAYNSFLTATPGNPNFMNPAIVTWKGDAADGDENTYSPVRFWPSGDTPSNLSFTAYYPYAESGNGITAPTFSGNVGAYEFTAAAAAANMIDFCVADVVNDQVYGNTNKGTSYKGTVNLPFKHMLTKVQFKFKKATGLGTTTVIELVDAELTGIKNYGKLTATYTQNGSSAVNAPGSTAYAWGSQSGNATYEVTVNTADPESGSVIVLTESETAVDSMDVFLMVPQEIAASTQKLNVTWNVKVFDTAANASSHASENTVGNNGLLSNTPNTAALSFFSDLKVSDTDDTPLGSAIQWGRNNFITYTVTIGPRPIWFTASVTEWDAEHDGYFNAQ